MKYVFKLLDTTTGEVRFCRDNVDYDSLDNMLFQWLENNNSCDCNRRILMYDIDPSEILNGCTFNIKLLGIRSEDGVNIDISSYEDHDENLYGIETMLIRIFNERLAKELSSVREILATKEAIYRYLKRTLPEAIEAATIDDITARLIIKPSCRIPAQIWVFVKDTPVAMLDREPIDCKDASNLDLDPFAKLQSDKESFPNDLFKSISLNTDVGECIKNVSDSIIGCEYLEYKLISADDDKIFRGITSDGYEVIISKKLTPKAKNRVNSLGGIHKTM